MKKVDNNIVFSFTPMKYTLKQIITRGIHIGHPTYNWNSKMCNYVHGSQDGNYVINLIKTRRQIFEAKKTASIARREGHKILFVGTKRALASLIKKKAQESHSSFVNKRWLGGILTNWFTIQLSLSQIYCLEIDKKNGVWLSVPKRKSFLLQKQWERLEYYFGGLKETRSLPGIVIIVGQLTEITALNECRKLGVPVICTLDTDCDPSLVDVGVPINDDSVTAVDLFLDDLLARIQEGRRWWLSKKSIQQGQGTPEIGVKRTRLFVL